MPSSGLGVSGFVYGAFFKGIPFSGLGVSGVVYVFPRRTTLKIAENIYGEFSKSQSLSVLKRDSNVENYPYNSTGIVEYAQKPSLEA